MSKLDHILEQGFARARAAIQKYECEAQAKQALQRLAQLEQDCKAWAEASQQVQVLVCAVLTQTEQALQYKAALERAEAMLEEIRERASFAQSSDCVSTLCGALEDIESKAEQALQGAAR